MRWTWLALAVLLCSGCHLLLGFPGTRGSADRSLEAGPPGEKGPASDATAGDRSLVDWSFTPCQESWANGWKLQGSAGLDCYGSCGDDQGGSYSIDCDNTGHCTCTGSGVNNTCPTGGCEDLVNAGCCK